MSTQQSAWLGISSFGVFGNRRIAEIVKAQVPARSIELPTRDSQRLRPIYKAAGEPCFDQGDLGLAGQVSSS